MTQLQITYPPGATPLDPDELAGLIPDYITTQGELNELGQKNIEQAVIWLRRRRPSDPLDLGFIYELHKQMFNQVWKWAGKTRTSEKNIGINWHQISTQVAELSANTKYLLEHKRYSLDEIAARFHHRLVQIHLFSNGNGRHARLITDLLIESNGSTAFTWGKGKGSAHMETEGPRRDEYIAALKEADQNSFELLLAFVRS